MTLARKSLWVLGAFASVLFLAALSIPNLLRSRQAVIRADEYQRMQQLQTYSSNNGALGGLKKESMQAAPMAVTRVSAQEATADAPDRKIIRNADLALVVKDVRESAEQIVQLVIASNGQLDSLNLSETREGCFNGTVVVRVPSSGLQNALTRFKSLAIRTEHEQITARDVTHEFYDNEAHLRNLRAEEQQYLVIMKQSGKIPDTLEVAERLSDVRDRIERQQAAMLAMSHDIEMSQVSITLTKQVDTKIAGFEWRPLQNARIATRDLLVGLGEWFDSVVALVVKLPLIAVWLLTIGGVLWILFSAFRWMWRRLRPLLPADPVEVPAKN